MHQLRLESRFVPPIFSGSAEVIKIIDIGTMGATLFVVVRRVGRGRPIVDIVLFFNELIFKKFSAVAWLPLPYYIL